ncbi:c-type cytochrome [Luteolibacter sp. SL250]|uniref:c-type cytochrome domain-containing protein n=1 Tax=Luteolibacter sp. SL250 TaxID=2995170 RepID=UPI00226DF52B|nr:c-type cytochrome domain-containing protein [Luteolibacter sp. SL250]WAC20878.1 c-type cytochrome [Luteolibacter sp. SL250]
MKPIILLTLLATPCLALDYKRDVLPIFEKKCFDCHSAGAEELKGGLRLDDEEHFFKRFAKNDVVVPGDWDASYLFVTVVIPPGEKGTMPPKNKGERLTEQEIMTVAKWIHEGAKIGREKGEKGSDEMEPSKILKFHNGQLLREGEEAPVAEAMPEWEEWTNRDGQKITAKFIKVANGKVSFELKGEKKVDYPLEQLSEESRNRILQRVEPDMTPMR